MAMGWQAQGQHTALRKQASVLLELEPFGLIWSWRSRLHALSYLSKGHADERLQSLIPVVMAGIIAVYSLVIAVLIAGSLDPDKRYSLFKWVEKIYWAGERSHWWVASGFLHLGAGLSVGLTGLAAGYAIGIVGDTVWIDFYSTCWKLALTPRRGFEHTCNNRGYS